MSREIMSHKCHLDDRQPFIEALGIIGAGGAEQVYRVSYYAQRGIEARLYLNFVSLVADGVTNEALLAIVADRLQGFQKGDLPCVENEVALSLVWVALNQLQQRTLKRIGYDVEGQARA